MQTKNKGMLTLKTRRVGFQPTILGRKPLATVG
ncbi:hypothetical protein TA5114_02099 [Cognatishimia activa]|uniref:Uncharacterized protein n=1 Tax=Cognatishimia activa TaxID=1715691 RepID=A0A0P1IZ81_9RHOB|nr:hypothetical protein TA5113_00927 [Cognatishimia activa]CUK26290.1 hypothetical protein TA5114_02099 [Cognatishimia activa]